MTFALHANPMGYTWPGVERIASRWRMDRETVRRQIGMLLVRRLIYRTKKRRGATGQVKVYRLPKLAYESGGKSTPNNDNDEVQKKKNHDVLPTLDNSIPITSNATGPSVSFGFESHQNQNRPAQNHMKWPEFAQWCRGKGGQPTEEGFWTWLRKQKPQWRNKVKHSFDQTGYVLDGKFLTTEEATRMGRENPEPRTKFRKATKCGDKIHVIDGFTLGFYSKICVTPHRSGEFTRQSLGGVGIRNPIFSAPAMLSPLTPCTPQEPPGSRGSGQHEKSHTWMLQGREPVAKTTDCEGKRVAYTRDVFPDCYCAVRALSLRRFVI